jgi:hypothetical protein
MAALLTWYANLKERDMVDLEEGGIFKKNQSVM